MLVIKFWYNTIIHCSAGVSTCTDQHLVQHQDVAFDGLSGFWTIGLSIRNLLACIGYTL